MRYRGLSVRERKSEKAKLERGLADEQGKEKVVHEEGTSQGPQGEQREWLLQKEIRHLEIAER